MIGGSPEVAEACGRWRRSFRWMMASAASAAACAVLAAVTADREALALACALLPVALAARAVEAARWRRYAAAVRIGEGGR